MSFVRKCERYFIYFHHCTDTYRNNMNDLDLIYFTEDEIYVRLPTVYMLLGY